MMLLVIKAITIIVLATQLDDLSPLKYNWLPWNFQFDTFIAFSYLYRLQNAINMLLLRQLQQCYDNVVDITQARQNDGRNGI